ncbi:MAG TPA: hypothetical protein VN931_11500 [Fibrobacteria bacterium]|nr:hypothetical protein [Fibrobacteria bacterium]
MRALDGELMLLASGRCRDAATPRGALALLELAAPEIPLESLADLPLARRDALLLQARAMTFGSALEGFASCPDCGAELEFRLDTRQLREGLETGGIRRDDGARPVNTSDLLACLGAADDEEAMTVLLSRTTGWEPVFGEKPPRDRVERFEELNAPAEIRLQLVCAACGGVPTLDLDIARFFARELGRAARHLMRDIHLLASAYGWSERAIAEMDVHRRASYLEMLGA